MIHWLKLDARHAVGLSLVVCATVAQAQTDNERARVEYVPERNLLLEAYRK